MDDIAGVGGREYPVTGAPAHFNNTKLICKLEQNFN